MLLAGTGLMVAPSVIAGSAAGAPGVAPPSLPAGCTQAQVGSMVVCSFASTGAEQSFVVPAGVNAVTVSAVGAAGGTNFSAAGGLGGTATASVAVTAGSTLYVEVGGAGGNVNDVLTAGAGGFNGGGPGGGGVAPIGFAGAGGGGASDVRTETASATGSLGSRLVVAAGGGGAAGYAGFASGGNAGSPGNTTIPFAQGGGAGTSSAGGAGGVGTYPGYNDGIAGALGLGGTGGEGYYGNGFTTGGGGGGGGQYGGGGGSSLAGGGGGSSYAPGGTTGVNTAGAAASVTISYQPQGPASYLVLTPTSPTVEVGQAQAFTAVSYNADGASLADVTGQTTFSISPDGSCLAATCLATVGGLHTVTGTYGPVATAITATADLTVDEAPAFTSADAATFTVGAAGSFTVTASGFPAPTLSESGTLPTGVTFDAATGLLAGVPGKGTGGVYAVTFTAENGITPPATQSFTLTVEEAPAFTSADAATFTVGAAGSFTVTASGFPAPTLSESGTLPEGVTLVDHHNGTATLAGTPAADTAGTYTLTVDAENGVSDPTQSFTLSIKNPASTPTTTTTVPTTTTTTAPTTTTATATTPAAATTLPFTGTNMWASTSSGLSLVTVGAMALIASRRRRH
jgi:large repetitive protein